MYIFVVSMNFKSAKNVLVKIDKKFQDEIITESGIKFFIDPSYSKEWNCTCVGKIEDLCFNAKTDEEKKTLSKLKKGDEVMFSYRVVSDVEFKSDSGQFMDISPIDSPTFKQYSNGKGEFVTIRAIQKSSFGMTWVGIYTDKKNEFIDGVQGSESDLERWLSQFAIGKTDNYIFRNLCNVNDTFVWKVDISDIFAKKKKNGEWLAVGDRVLMKPVEVDITRQVAENTKIIMPESTLKARFYDRAEVLSGGDEIGIKKGDIVGFEERYLEKYDIEGNQYFLIKKRRVNGVWDKNN